MFATLTTLPRNEAKSSNANNNNNNNMSWTSRCLVLLRRRTKTYDDDDGKAQQDLESCTTATIVSTLSSAEDDDDDEMTTTTEHEDRIPRRVSFDPHVVTVEFDKEEEGRQEDMWIRSEEWYRMDLELRADVARFHRAILLPLVAQQQQQEYDGAYGDRGSYGNDSDTDDEYDGDVVDLYDEDIMDTERIQESEYQDFSAFRGLEHYLFPLRCQMRRRMVLRAVLAEQAQQEGYQDGDEDDAVENVAEASQVWSRRDVYRAWELGQADAHVVRMELLHEWKQQEQQQQLAQQEGEWENPMSL